VQTDQGLAAVRNCLVADSILVSARAVVAVIGGSAALAADSLHGFSDVFTTLFLGAAFVLAKKSATSRYTYGFHRAEDLVGLLILAFLGVSAFLSARASILKLVQGTETSYLLIGMAVALIGAAGKEIIALYKVRIGRRIDSVALVADGRHSRADGLTSVGAFLGLLGVYVGFPILDPVFGFLITGAIVVITIRLSRDVIGRLLDTIDPETYTRVEDIALSVPGVKGVHDLRARWAGHRIFCEMHVTVDDALNISEAHEIGVRVVETIKRELASVEQCLVHLGPESCDTTRTCDPDSGGR
jgi:cation diffusion facilitator family transporter